MPFSVTSITGCIPSAARIAERSARRTEIERNVAEC